MKYILSCLIILFYLFFFLRALILSKALGKSIKGNSVLVNFSVFFAGLSSIIFFLQLFTPRFKGYFLMIDSNAVLGMTGAFFIAIGLLFSIVASLNLGKSWRIGIDSNEKTELVTCGVYKFSRNPYFLAYDIVIIGTSLCSPSLLLFLLSTTTIILFHFLIIKEEKYLETKHGNDYRKYKKETRRYL
ncbi:isoprenylcysteine carboxylmethyltransferase family protein [candidate division WOR-3 bacterium]|nr:isoprenylcysteine carboxylmethyltransferase family protein [candidate division WOR-3 bacterium]